MGRRPGEEARLHRLRGVSGSLRRSHLLGRRAAQDRPRHEVGPGRRRGRVRPRQGPRDGEEQARGAQPPHAVRPRAPAQGPRVRDARGLEQRPLPPDARDGRRHGVPRGERPEGRRPERPRGLGALPRRGDAPRRRAARRAGCPRTSGPRWRAPRSPPRRSATTSSRTRSPSGHVAGTWGDVATRKGTHDYYNQNGFDAITWSGKPMLMFGDANMKPADLARAAASVRASFEEVLDAASPGWALAAEAEAIPLDWAKAVPAFDTCKTMKMPSAEGVPVSVLPEGGRADPPRDAEARAQAARGRHAAVPVGDRAVPRPRGRNRGRRGERRIRGGRQPEPRRRGHGHRGPRRRRPRGAPRRRRRRADLPAGGRPAGARDEGRVRRPVLRRRRRRRTSRSGRPRARRSRRA